MGLRFARFTGILFLLGFNASQNVFAQEWQVDLKDPVSALQVIAAKDLRWPPMSGQESEYRSQSELLTLAAVWDEFYPLAPSQLSMSFENWDVQYKPMKVFKIYNEARIQKLRDQLTDVAKESLPGLAVLDLQNEAQLFAILKKDKELFQRLVLLWPLRSYGTLQRDRTLFQIQNLTAEKLDELLRDRNKMFFFQKLEAMGKGDQVAEKALAWVKRVYFQGMVEPAFAMATSWRTLAAPGHLRVESAPPLIALARGECGRDCARKSVPLYALSKDARVFYVWNTNTDLPDAYVFVVKVKVEDRDVPYIVTINGQSLDFSQVRSLVALVSQIYETNEVVVPNFRINNSVVNNSLISSALEFAKSRRIEVEMPEDWKTIGEFSQAHDTRYRATYPDLYARETINDAILVNLEANPENEALQLFTKAGDPQVYERIPLDELGTSQFRKFRWLKAMEEAVRRKALPRPLLTIPKSQTLITHNQPVPYHDEMGMAELRPMPPADLAPKKDFTTEEIRLRPDLLAQYKAQASWIAQLLLAKPHNLEVPSEMEDIASFDERKNSLFGKIARYFTKPVLEIPFQSSTVLNQLDQPLRAKLIAIWNDGNPLHETLETWATKRGCARDLEGGPGNVFQGLDGPN